MVKSFTLNAKDIFVLNDVLDIIKFVDIETLWFNERITDEEFDIAYKFFTNLGYIISDREELMNLDEE